MTISPDEQNKALYMAETMANEFDAEQANEFGKRHTDKAWYENFRILYRMITDPNHTLDATTWSLIAGALAYVVFPIDLIPDFIPVLGWMDDAFVLAAVTAQLAGTIAQYKAKQQGDDHGSKE